MAHVSEDALVRGKAVSNMEVDAGIKTIVARP